MIRDSGNPVIFRPALGIVRIENPETVSILSSYQYIMAVASMVDMKNDGSTFIYGFCREYESFSVNTN